MRGRLSWKRSTATSGAAGVRDSWDSLYCIFDAAAGTLEAFGSEPGDAAEPHSVRVTALHSWRACFTAPHSMRGTFVGTATCVRDIPDRRLKRSNRFDLQVVDAAAAAAAAAASPAAATPAGAEWLELAAPSDAEKQQWFEAFRGASEQQEAAAAAAAAAEAEAVTAAAAEAEARAAEAKVKDESKPEEEDESKGGDERHHHGGGRFVASLHKCRAWTLFGKGEDHAPTDDAFTAVALSRSGCTVAYADWSQVHVLFNAGTSDERHFESAHSCTEQEGPRSIHLAVADGSHHDPDDPGAEFCGVRAVWTSGKEHKVMCRLDDGGEVNVFENLDAAVFGANVNVTKAEVEALALSADGSVVAMAIEGRVLLKSWDASKKRWNQMAWQWGGESTSSGQPFKGQPFKRNAVAIEQLALSRSGKGIGLAVNARKAGGGHIVGMYPPAPVESVLATLPSGGTGAERLDLILESEYTVLMSIAPDDTNGFMQIACAVADMDGATTIVVKKRPQRQHGHPGDAPPARCCSCASMCSTMSCAASGQWDFQNRFLLEGLTARSLVLVKNDSANLLALGSQNGTVRVYDCNGVLHRECGDDDPVVSVALCAGSKCPHGTRLISGSGCSKVEMRGAPKRVAENQMVLREWKTPAPKRGEGLPAPALMIATSSDGTTKATLVPGQPKVLRLEELNVSKKRKGVDSDTTEMDLPEVMRGVVLSNYGSTLVLISSTSFWVAFDIYDRDGALASSTQQLNLIEFKNESPAADDNFATASVSVSCGTVRMLHERGTVRKEVVIRSFSLCQRQSLAAVVFRPKSRMDIKLVRLSADGTAFGVAVNKQVSVFDVPQGDIVDVSLADPAGGKKEACSPSCKRLCHYSHERDVTCLALSDDGKVVASGGMDYTFHVFDALVPHDGAAAGTTVSIEKRPLFFSRAQHGATKPSYTFKAGGKCGGYGGIPQQVALSSDGSLLATCHGRLGERSFDVIIHDLLANDRNANRQTAECAAPVILPASAINLNWEKQEDAQMGLANFRDDDGGDDVLDLKTSQRFIFAFSTDCTQSTYLLMSWRCQRTDDYDCNCAVDVAYGIAAPPSPVDLVTLAEKYPETAKFVLARHPHAVNNEEATFSHRGRGKDRATTNSAIQNCLLPKRHVARREEDAKDEWLWHLDDDIATSTLKVLLQRHYYDESGNVASDWGGGKEMAISGNFDNPFRLAFGHGEGSRIKTKLLDLLAQFAAKRCSPLARSVPIMAELVGRYPAIATRLLQQIALENTRGGSRDDSTWQIKKRRLCAQGGEQVNTHLAKVSGGLLLGSSPSPLIAQFSWLVQENDGLVVVNKDTDMHTEGNVVATSPLMNAWLRLSRGTPDDAEVVEARVLGLPCLMHDSKFLDNLADCKYLPLFGTEGVKAVLEYQWRTRHFAFNLIQMGLFCVLLVSFVCWIFFVHGNPSTANTLEGGGGFFAFVSFAMSAFFVAFEIFQATGIYLGQLEALQSADAMMPATAVGAQDKPSFAGGSVSDDDDGDCTVSEGEDDDDSVLDSASIRVAAARTDETPIARQDLEDQLAKTESAGAVSEPVAEESTGAQRACTVPQKVVALWRTLVDYFSSGWNWIDMLWYARPSSSLAFFSFSVSSPLTDRPSRLFVAAIGSSSASH